MMVRKEVLLMGYRFLRGKIAERGIKKNTIALELGITTKALKNKIDGVTPFKWEEACKIHDRFFPDVDKDTLFATDEQTA